MENDADLLDLYAIATNAMVTSTSASISDDPKFFKALSFLYGAYNEWKFMENTAPPSNTRD